jgi:tRNA uridine 5-carboxymethylaminomethyl modification enzyme
MLNKSKGPAVWSPRAQADRIYYSRVAQDRLLKLKSLTIIEASANGLCIKNQKVLGVFIATGHLFLAKTVIITSGTFLNGVIHIGLKNFKAGRAGEKAAVGITESLLSEGIEAGRLKTGTPPRLAKDSINFNKFEIQEPDDPPVPFSYSTQKITQKQIPCHIGHTNAETHDVLREGFDQSPLFLGRIKAVGPRYCPSIEDKVNRFSQKNRHQLFLEPEGYENQEIYLNGFSTSLPESIQRKAIKTISGLEKAEIVRLGYAVEYDYFPPHQLKFSLESKIIENLFFAGQINGTSGYEEAAAQGLIAGINAAHKVLGKVPFKLKRSDAYIGVLIDDLINKSTREPYRMFTSRAEFRLLLRQDNADIRLYHFGKDLGLLSSKECKRVLRKIEEIKILEQYLSTKNIPRDEFNAYFGNRSSAISQPVNAAVLLRRPEIHIKELLSLFEINRFGLDVQQEVEFNIKYDGYIKRNQDLINRFIEQEDKVIPTGFDFLSIQSLSTEAKEKLEKIRPESFGQASRISGVSPADLSVLLIYLERLKRQGNVPRETKGKS